MVAGAAMSDARSEMLSRVRDALRDVPEEEQPKDVPVPRGYRREGDQLLHERLERFEERLRDYRATVRRAAADGVGTALLDACRELGLRRVAIPPGLPVAWRPAGPIDVIEDEGLSARELDLIDGVITGCAAAIAETGTLVLDGQGASGRRVLTLVPDHHICIVTADQVLGLVPEAISRVAPAVTERRLPVTLISGPSATSDIELKRVEGVHGPRHLVVVIVSGDA
jgi:L-lactate dehydrogenase complex protein LldG